MVVRSKLKPEKEKFYCRMCMDYKLKSAFYDATNPMIDKNGLMSICRDHCNEIYAMYFGIYGNMELALQLTCQDLDVRFSKETLRQTQSHIESLITKGKPAEKVFGYYKSKLASTGKTNEGLDSFRYQDSDFEFNSDTKLCQDKDFAKKESDYDVTEETVKYWGRNKQPWEYEYLEEELFKLKSSFECSDYGMEMLMKDIAFINLDIEKCRQGNKGDVSKLIQTRGALMNDAKIKPIQSSGAEANDQITFGTLIKKLENERPVDEPSDEWKDPDNLEKWHKIFIGHLADMNDIDNDLVKEYKETIKPYTVVREDEEEGEEEDG